MSMDQRIRDGLRTANDEMPMPDVESALAAVIAASQQPHRRHVVAVVIAGLGALNDDHTDSQQPVDPEVTSSGRQKKGH